MINTKKMNEDCIIWDGKKCAGGRYGFTYFNEKFVMAHRLAWMKTHGDIPKGLCVCHTCDEGLCVNVNHLFLGTLSDNMQDALVKGRHKGIANLGGKNQRHESNKNAKINLNIANMIRSHKLKYPEDSYEKIRRIFGFKSKGHIYNIIKLKIWI